MVPYLILTIVVSAIVVGALVVLASRRGRLVSLEAWLSYFFFVFGLEFIALIMVQLAGLEAYAGFVAGAVGGIAVIIGSILYLRPAANKLNAQVAGFEIQPHQLKHVVAWLGSIVIEGEVQNEPDRKGILDKLAALRKGDIVSYNLTTDRGKSIAGNASVKGVVTKVKSDGRLFFAITMRRESRLIRTENQ